MRIAVIIVTWNKSNFVLSLLNSLNKIKKENYKLDYFVVDNASTDDTVLLIKKYHPDVNLIVNKENLGGTGGFNTGISSVVKSGKYEYLWLLDNDVVLDENTFIELINAMKTDNNIGAIGSQMRQLENPEIINENGGLIIPEMGGVYLLHHGMKVDEFAKLKESQKLISVHYCAAASLLVRKEVIDKVGLWADMFIHFDDIEWCMRIRKYGYKIYCNPKSIIWHMSMISKPVTWIRYYDVRNYLYLLMEYYGGNSAFKAINRFRLSAIKNIVLGKEEFANNTLLGINDFIRGIKGKSLHNLNENTKVINWGEFATELMRVDKVVISPNFSGTNVENIINDLRNQIKSLFVYSSENDFMAGAYLLGSNLYFYPNKRMKRFFKILLYLIIRKKIFDIAIVPYNNCSLLLNIITKNVYAVVDNGLVKLENNIISIILNILKFNKKWKKTTREIKVMINKMESIKWGKMKELQQ
ncbi:glycosyltransferase family 2 protein [Alicyclobacillus sp. TC]|uniref:glycosyltransferase family 2 protein n=1 Tax=Alicyclobacillus sp. TC TaxID=2606450 RepID=UPI001934051E|nr:glycosyltransferase family 2 protein [Alicyclobacillus sp. TC]